MINVSSEFRDKLNNGNCRYLSYADITLEDGTTLNLTNEDIWSGGVTIEDAVSSGTFEIGAAVINQCTLVINNIYDKYTKYNFKNAAVTVKLGIDLNEKELNPDLIDNEPHVLSGKSQKVLTTKSGSEVLTIKNSVETQRIEKIKKGTFKVDETKYNGSIITLVCLDNMSKFDRAYSESKLEYPATLKAIVMDACSVCGVALNTPDFKHNDYIINKRPADEAITFREVIAWCGQISGNYCRCNVNGQLDLKWFDQNALENALINLIEDNLFDDGVGSWTATDSKIGTETIEYKKMLFITPDSGKTGYVTEAIPNLKAANFTVGGQFFMQYPEDNDIAIVKILNGSSEIASKEIPLNDGWTGFRFDLNLSVTNVTIKIGFKGNNTLYLYKPYFEEKLADEIYEFKGNYKSDVATDDVVITGVRVTEKRDVAESSADSDTDSGNDSGTDDTEETETQDVTQEIATDSGYKSYQSGSDGYVISIENNELIKDGAGETVSGFLGEQLIGFAFRKATITHISDPILEAGDVAILTDSNFDRYKVLISSTKFNTNNSQTTSSNAESTEKNSAVRYSAVTKNYVDYRKDLIKEKTDREKALEELGKRIDESDGVFTTEEEDSAGGKIYYLHNKPKLEESDMVWKMTAEAWAVSTDGGKTWNAGMTVDGDTIVRYLTAVGLSADVITSGRILVKDSEGNIIFLVDMDTGKVIINGDNITIGGKSINDSINSKSRVFVSQPSPPYNVGDMWNQGQDGDILTCVIARKDGEGYIESDWQKLNKYTDDETANKAIEEARKSRAMLINLDNDYQAITTDYKGEYTTFPECHTTAQVLYGHTDITNDCTYRINTSNGISGSWDKQTHTYTVTDLTTYTGWVDITANYLNTYSITKRFDVSKLKCGIPGEKGDAGAAGRTYFMESSCGIIKLSKDNAFSPKTINFAGYYRDGVTTARTAYQCRFKISVILTDDTETTIYSSEKDESNVDYTPTYTANMASVKCTMYARGSFSQVLDTETIPIAIDVSALTQEDVFNLLTNNGKWKGIYKDASGNMYISFDFARGGKLNLGGNADTYGNGELHVYNYFDKEIVTIDKEGVLVQNYSLGISADEKPASYTCLGRKVFSDGMYISENKDGSEKCVLISPGTLIAKDDDESASTIIFGNRVEINASKGIYCEPTGWSKKGPLFQAENYNSGSLVEMNADKINMTGDTTLVGTIGIAGYTSIDGDFNVTGSKNRIIDTENYDTRKQYCYETATPYFGDIGTAQTDETGKCYINIDDIFSETVNTGVEYQVFLQKEGQGDIWVEEKADNYFVVCGTEKLKFSWEIKVIQRDYEFERLEKFDNTEKEETIDYEKEYMEEINDLIKEQEEILDETA